ncbi:hypothetical protein ACFL4N_04400 [Thermodesulfobacteriota bacterium]
METITITLPKKMPIGSRILETGRQLRAWAQDFHVLFNDEKDKLQFAKWEYKNAEYHYHYFIVRSKTLSAGKVNIKNGESRTAPSEIPGTALQEELAPPAFSPGAEIEAEI